MMRYFNKFPRFARLCLLTSVIISLLVVIGCGPSAAPIIEVTPLLMESAEIKSTETIATPAPEVSEADMATAVLLDHTLPTPAPEELAERGASLAEVYEDDLKWEVVAPNPIEFDEEPVLLQFNEFFVDYDPWSLEPPELSDKLLSLDGKRVIIEGYMAPPLKLGLDWFMLTGFPMGACPFHSSTATITPDIALVYVDGDEIPYTWEPIRLVGELHVGGSVDPETGMVSLVRIYTETNEIEKITFSQ